MRALVMAGGKGARIGPGVEKPLMELYGRKLIDIVLQTLSDTAGIDGTCVATSDNAPRTREYVKRNHEDVVLIDTKGSNYHDDLIEAIKKKNICHPILVLPSDMPLLEPEFLTGIISSYGGVGQDSLSVFIRTDKEALHGSASFILDGERVVPAGINIINGACIGEKEIPQFNLMVDYHPRFININSKEDLRLAMNHFQK